MPAREARVGGTQPWRIGSTTLGYWLDKRVRRRRRVVGVAFPICSRARRLADRVHDVYSVNDAICDDHGRFLRRHGSQRREKKNGQHN